MKFENRKFKSHKSFLLIWVFNILLIGSFTSCSGRKENSKNNDESNEKGTIEVDGSSTVNPVTAAIAEEYRNEHPDVKVITGISGTGGGFDKFLRGRIDISNASRPINEEEIQQARENGIEFIELTIASDGLAVLVHPENNWVENITVEELKKIWEPGAQEKITRWNQIKAEWPNKNIHLYGPGFASGTYDYFTQVIVGGGGSSRRDFTTSEEDEFLVKAISTDKNSLGFFGLSYYKENSEKLKLVPVDNGNGPVKPTIETVSGDKYRPLSRPLFIYVSKEAAKKGVVRNFVKYYLTRAGDKAKEVGYVPLTDDKYQEELDRFNKF